MVISKAESVGCSTAQVKSVAMTGGLLVVDCFYQAAGERI